MAVSLRTAACAVALCALGLGCNTSSDDVIISGITDGADPRSLSVAWVELEQRLVRLEAEVQIARAETRRLCQDGAPAEHPICASLKATQTRVADLGNVVQTIDFTVDGIDERVVQTERTLSPFSYDERTKTVVFTGVNVQVRNGTGSTGGDTDGTGNLIVGWNEADDNDSRIGSHNVIVGRNHAWEGHSSLAVGFDHAVLGDGVATIGGEANTAVGEGSVLLAGQDNHAMGVATVSVGGAENTLTEELSVTVGGYSNSVDAALAVVIGGSEVRAVEPGEILVPTRLGPAGELHPEYPQ